MANLPPPLSNAGITCATVPERKDTGSLQLKGSCIDLQKSTRKLSVLLMSLDFMCKQQYFNNGSFPVPPH